MPPCFDVYALIVGGDRPGLLARFIDEHVDTANPGEPRFAAFVRTFVEERPAPGDLDALADLRRDEAATHAFSLYLRGTTQRAVIITLTEDGDLVLGISLDDSLGDADTTGRASSTMTALVAGYGAAGAVGGVELPPPQSRAEWLDDEGVLLRIASVV